MTRNTPLKSRKGFAAMTAIRQAAKVAQEKGKAVAIKPTLRRSKATPANAAQVRRWKEAKARGCVACHLNTVDHGLARASFQHDLEMHHLLSGGRRRGHDETICLCTYHHQGGRLPYPDRGYEAHAKAFGPSFGREPRRFREVYGTDDELLAYQNIMLERGSVLCEVSP